MVRKAGTQYVTVPKEEWESMKATMEILSDSKLMQEIVEGRKQVKEGRVTSWADVMREFRARKAMRGQS